MAWFGPCKADGSADCLLPDAALMALPPAPHPSFPPPYDRQAIAAEFKASGFVVLHDVIPAEALCGALPAAI